MIKPFKFSKLKRKRWMMPFTRSRHMPLTRNGKLPMGFTLTELMAASALMSLVILITWTGLTSALNMSRTAQARTARKFELTSALNVMTNEVRRAQRVNQSDTLIADGSVSVEEVVTSAGINLNDLGDYGEIALYLELPTNLNSPTCNTDAGPVVADAVDRVVYDIRTSPTGWLTPDSVVRYGRIPDVNGAIDPCSLPVANDIMADAIADVDDTPPCTGTLTGGRGFHTCMKDENIELLLKSSIDGLEITPVSGNVTNRKASFTPNPESIEEIPELQLSVAFLDDDREEVTLSWRWAGASVDERYEKLEGYLIEDGSPWPYRVNIQDGKKTLKIPVGDPESSVGINMRYELRTEPGNACFMVEGITPEQKTVESNRVCVVNGQM